MHQLLNVLHQLNAEETFYLPTHYYGSRCCRNGSFIYIFFRIFTCTCMINRIRCRDEHCAYTLSLYIINTIRICTYVGIYYIHIHTYLPWCLIKYNEPNGIIVLPTYSYILYRTSQSRKIANDYLWNDDNT